MANTVKLRSAARLIQLRPVVPTSGVIATPTFCSCFKEYSDRRSLNSVAGGAETGTSLGPNDVPSLQFRNKNPMNLERMRIGYQPSGFLLDRRRRNYWNALDLKISQQHTTAVVTHWTGREVCSASTKEWAIRKFLYNYTDGAALQCVGKVIGQRCIETGVSEVSLLIDKQDMKKERMQVFVRAIEGTGLLLEEGRPYKQYHPHHYLDPNRPRLHGNVPVKPWNILEE